MAKFEIIVGSVLGASEYVADALQETLLTHSQSSTIHLAPQLSDLNNDATWIICTSTHGAGELPDNIQPLAEQLKSTNLPATKFLVVGLGDSSYDTFCFGAIQIEKIMQIANGQLLVPSLHIDVLNHPIPEDVAVDWLLSWLSTQEQSA